MEILSTRRIFMYLSDFFLLFILLWTLLTFLAVNMVEGGLTAWGIARLILVSVSALFLPGLLCVKAFLSGDRLITKPEELAFSFGLSLVILFSIGLLANLTSFGVRIQSVTVFLIAWIIIFGVVARLRQRSIMESRRDFTGTEEARGWLNGKFLVLTVLSIALVYLIRIPLNLISPWPFTPYAFALEKNLNLIIESGRWTQRPMGGENLTLVEGFVDYFSLYPFSLIVRAELYMLSGVSEIDWVLPAIQFIIAVAFVYRLVRKRYASLGAAVAYSMTNSNLILLSSWFGNTSTCYVLNLFGLLALALFVEYGHRRFFVLFSIFLFSSSLSAPTGGLAFILICGIIVLSLRFLRKIDNQSFLRLIVILGSAAMLMFVLDPGSLGKASYALIYTLSQVMGVKPPSIPKAAEALILNGAIGEVEYARGILSLMTAQLSGNPWYFIPDAVAFVHIVQAFVICMLALLVLIFRGWRRNGLGYAIALGWIVALVLVYVNASSYGLQSRTLDYIGLFGCVSFGLFFNKYKRLSKCLGPLLILLLALSSLFVILHPWGIHRWYTQGEVDGARWAADNLHGPIYTDLRTAAILIREGFDGTIYTPVADYSFETYAVFYNGNPESIANSPIGEKVRYLVFTRTMYTQVLYPLNHECIPIPQRVVENYRAAFHVIFDNGDMVILRI